MPPGSKWMPSFTELGPGAIVEPEVHLLVGRHLEVGEDEALHIGRGRQQGIALGQQIALHATTCERTIAAYRPPCAISVSWRPASRTRPWSST